MSLLSRLFPVCLALIFIPGLAHAAPDAETQYILNSFLFLICGCLVMFMAAGFCCLESGFVRSTSVTTICVKNIGVYAVAGLVYYLMGYNLMYSGVDGGYFGHFFSPWSADDSGHLNIDGAFTSEDSGLYASSSDWFFQMVFVATAASIVSGAIAERVKLWSFLLFSALLCGFIYPITGSWHWGGGWLAEKGFYDFAGSTLVHSVGGWAALVGVVLVGARKGRFSKEGKSLPMPASSIPLATLGTFILWLGWFGFNGGSQLALGSALDATSIATIFVNTNIGAAAGLFAAMLFTQLVYRKVDPSLILNGALAGLVSITADPLSPSIGEAALIGAVGAILMALAVPLLDKFRLDDVVGAIPVHLVCGIWGTLAVAFTNPEANFGVQLLGVLAIGAFTIVASLLVWSLVRMVIGLRISDEMEEMGIDIAETGLDAYPEFVRHKG